MESLKEAKEWLDKVHGLASQEPLFRIFFAALLWIVLIFCSEFYAFRVIQTKVYETPSDRLLEMTNGLEIFQAIRAFPFFYFKIIVAVPIVFLIVASIATFAQKFKKKGLNWVFYISMIFSFLFSLVIVFAILKWGFNYDGELLKLSTSSITLFCLSLWALNQTLWDINVTATDKRYGARSFIFSAGVVTLWFSFNLVSTAFSSGIQERNFIALICKDLSLIQVKTGTGYRPGWLISRNSEYLILRAQEEMNYKTVQFPNNQISEISFEKKSESIDEKSIAFPACDKFL